ncbi:hypothetical protein NQ317_005244 [Molorchus minor]|uniref:Uncharacterized protein n=1 Tax=Molorchus minor TaxID=1323400 RepID=A0ABQ9JFX0_9CUCU|nr:hypothetical protein NQ317_005244 [Molorchus minor]
MGVVPDLRHGSWKFSSEPLNSQCSAVSVSLHSQSELSAEQSKILNELVTKSFDEMVFGRELPLRNGLSEDKTDATIQFDRSSINDERCLAFSRLYKDVEVRLIS